LTFNTVAASCQSFNKWLIFSKKLVVKVMNSQIWLAVLFCHSVEVVLFNQFSHSLKSHLGNLTFSKFVNRYLFTSVFTELQFIIQKAVYKFAKYFGIFSQFCASGSFHLSGFHFSQIKLFLYLKTGLAVKTILKAIILSNLICLKSISNASSQWDDGIIKLCFISFKLSLIFCIIS